MTEAEAVQRTERIVCHLDGAMVRDESGRVFTPTKEWLIKEVSRELQNVAKECEWQKEALVKANARIVELANEVLSFDKRQREAAESFRQRIMELEGKIKDREAY